MHHDPLATVLEIGEGGSREPELFRDGTLGEAKFFAPVRNSAAEATIEFKIRHPCKLTPIWVLVKADCVYHTNI